MFSCRLCETFKNSFFIEHQWTSAFERRSNFIKPLYEMNTVRRIWCFSELQVTCRHRFCNSELRNGIPGTHYIDLGQRKSWHQYCILATQFYSSINFEKIFSYKCATSSPGAFLNKISEWVLLRKIGDLVFWKNLKSLVNLRYFQDIK